MSEHLDEITSTLDRLADAWATNDGEAVASYFAEDGSLINPFGERADGRPAIAAMYTDYFRGMLGGTSTRIDVESVRDAGAGHVLVDGEQAISAPDGNVVLSVHFANLLRREDGEWRVVDARPYVYATPPG